MVINSSLCESYLKNSIIFRYVIKKEVGFIITNSKGTGFSLLVKTSLIHISPAKTLTRLNEIQ